MNCEECKEQILELIEAERTDPQSVHEVLERCPGCRLLFDRAKATLDLAGDLTLEEPSAVVDQSVLGAARAHAAKVSPPLKRARFRPGPWAAAAVAMLAVGVGVWSILETTAPTSEPRALDVALQDDSDARDEERHLVERELTPADDRAVAARPVSKKLAPPAPSVAERSSKPRIRASRSVERDVEAIKGLGNAGPTYGGAAAPTSSEAGLTTEESAPSEPCSRRLAEVEDEGRDVSDEEALELGRCYRDAQDFAEARRWLERALASPETKKRAADILQSLPDP